MTEASKNADTDMLAPSLFLAITLHLVVILGVSFTVGEPTKQAPPDKTLGVTIVQHPQTVEENETPDFLAQTTQLGSGNTEEKEAPKTQLQTPTVIASEEATTTAIESTTQQPKLNQAPEVLTSQNKASHARKNTEPKPTDSYKHPTMAQLLASTQREIEVLSAEIDTQTKMFASKPRRKQLSASTREYKYANYHDAWRRKVERIGNLNYPEEAKRKKLHGNLILTVAIKADGTINNIQVRRSSGIKILDDAAIRIVRLAAPYSPFPAEIRKEYDILDITRTWQFRNNNELHAQ